MANELEKAITVREAIQEIDAGRFLLPAIQRRFVWNTRQIEFLFDSILQDYPINTFMFWDVRSEEIKNNFRFYDFLKKYVEYEGGNNQERVTKGYPEFKAVIDGQQRLNSLYIGLKGSYARRAHVARKKKYYQNEKDYPTRKLFLDILSPLEDNEERKVYDFKFLIVSGDKKEHELAYKMILDDEGKGFETPCLWFEVSKILEFNSQHDILIYLTSSGLPLDGFGAKTLFKLYELINTKPIINFYLEKEQQFDKVLYEFIRTNSGGTKLSFADLFMSIITASWEKGKSTHGAREEIDSLIKQIRTLGFDVTQDLILKTCLVLMSEDIKFKLANFKSDFITDIRSNWEKISQCILESFKLIKALSFNNYSLRAKNSAIPVIHFLYRTNFYLEINKENQHKESKALIKKFLHISMINKVFGGSSDGFLKKIKSVIETTDLKVFPLPALQQEFRNTNRRLHLLEEQIQTLLRISYNSLDSFYILSLLFPKFNFELSNPNIDHLYPKSHFNQEKYDREGIENVDFFNNHFNTVLNLAFLSEEQNKSKNDKDLKSWILEQEIHNSGIRNDLFIPEQVDLEFSQFENFILEREKLLSEKIRTEIN